MKLLTPIGALVLALAPLHAGTPDDNARAIADLMRQRNLNTGSVAQILNGTAPVAPAPAAPAPVAPVAPAAVPVPATPAPAPTRAAAPATPPPAPTRLATRATAPTLAGATSVCLDATIEDTPEHLLQS